MSIHHPKLAPESSHFQSFLGSPGTNTFAEPAEPKTKASQACLSCRAQKKKCDKSVPSCGLCARVRRACNYSVEPLSASASEGIQSLQRKVRLLEAQLDNYNNHGSPVSSDSWRSLSRPPGTSSNGLEDIDQGDCGIPSAFFLDGAAFKFGRYQIGQHHLHLPQVFEDVCPTTMTIRNIVDNYFRVNDPWLPMISIELLNQSLNVPLEYTNADMALLYLAMKLLGERLPHASQNPQTSFYLSVKEYYFFVESAGILSVPLLQAGLLLATYELGHAIFPAAYLTIGRCAKISYAMNFHDTSGTPQSVSPPRSWAEMEERRRVWWCVLILDRYVALGNPGLALSCDDLSRVDYLPSTETSWNESDAAASEPLFLSSPPNAPAGHYARLCQASHLLGKIIRHCRDRTLDREIRFQEAIQLNRLLQALTVVTSADVAEEPTMTLISTMALCYSGMMVLNKPYSEIESFGSPADINIPEDFQKHALATFRLAAMETINFAASLDAYLSSLIGQVSPLIAHCLYQAASMLLWLNQDAPGDANVSEGLEFLRETLRKLDRRWKVAGTVITLILSIIGF